MSALTRQEVELFLAEGGEGRWSRPTIEQMAELCRTWLAVDAAPLKEVDIDGWLDCSLPDTYAGTTVRIVPEATP